MTDTTPNHGPALERGIWVAVIIAALIVILRVFAKIKINRFNVDDVLMIIASISAIASTVFLTLSVQHGFGKPLGDPFTHDTSLVLKYIAIQIPIVTLSTTIARTSFIIYLVAVLGTKKAYQISLWIVLAIQLAGNIASAVLPLSICKNVNILWDPTVKTTCGDDAAVIKFAYFSNTFNSATDLFLAVFPTVVFWNLNLKLRIKISLIVLLSLGIVAMVASIIKTTKLDTLPSITNLGTTGGIELIRWGYVENAIIIITSSIPCIRPLIISSVRKFSSITRSYELSHRQTAQNDNTQSRKIRSNLSNLKRPRDVEHGSVDRILEQSQTTHSGTFFSSEPESPRGVHPSIMKQVDIEVISDDEASRSDTTRRT
ncbi:hypothetical protein N7532_011274 [Penicillium argentinense]|uniref:Rhodopsin domain-containing protein n=1 Tax=Penicillium argentinense TaxID=1131581 RepID=A0A9W9JUT9_9EURO|nr:uncharacterized protein N7532_011274 [Penicillium argentinense]KAJ5082231.1 hypothetical protein N7532_011274 [Penicillium argentinense]